MKVEQSSEILIGDYLFQNKLKPEVLSLLDVSNPIPREHSNVQAFHTEWDWQPQNLKIKNLKAFIQAEIERFYKPGAMADTSRAPLQCRNFWANVYYKGDYAQSHDHKPFHYSFAYFLKCENYHAPLVFSESGRKVPPKEGRFVAFPAHFMHHVPKQLHDDTRITLSGNFYVQI